MVCAACGRCVPALLLVAQLTSRVLATTASHAEAGAVAVGGMNEALSLLQAVAVSTLFASAMHSAGAVPVLLNCLSVSSSVMALGVALVAKLDEAMSFATRALRMLCRAAPQVTATDEAGLTLVDALYTTAVVEPVRATSRALPCLHGVGHCLWLLTINAVSHCTDPRFQVLHFMAAHATLTKFVLAGVRAPACHYTRVMRGA